MRWQRQQHRQNEAKTRGKESKQRKLKQRQGQTQDKVRQRQGQTQDKLRQRQGQTQDK